MWILLASNIEEIFIKIFSNLNKFNNLTNKLTTTIINGIYVIDKI
jgi:hypothetical protein